MHCIIDFGIKHGKMEKKKKLNTSLISLRLNWKISEATLSGMDLYRIQ